MKNINRKQFLDYVGKIDDTDNDLKYKSGCVYNKEIFFTPK